MFNPSAGRSTSRSCEPGGIELGHLAAPSRTEATIDATASNLHRAAITVGTHPLVENVATIIDPPGSALDERAWLTRLLATTSADLLLDLHNLFANALNFGFEAVDVLRAIPPERIRTIHLAGGTSVHSSSGEARWLDDHLHDVPDPVYDLLEIVGESVPHPIDVVLETGRRVSAVPSTARAARARPCCAWQGQSATARRVMTPAFESFLARLYVDPDARARFLGDPTREAAGAGLSSDEIAAARQIDRVGLKPMWAIAVAKIAIGFLCVVELVAAGHASGVEVGDVLAGSRMVRAEPPIDLLLRCLPLADQRPNAKRRQQAAGQQDRQRKNEK